MASCFSLLISLWEGLPAWFPSDSAWGVNHENLTTRLTEGAELSCGSRLPEVSITQWSERHATSVSNHLIRGLLDLRIISTTPPERHFTKTGREQDSKGHSDEVTALRSICPVGTEDMARIRRP